MSIFFCHTKEKHVEVYIKGISTSTIEDVTSKSTDGMLECSGSDMQCTKDNCPFLMDQ